MEFSQPNIFYYFFLLLIPIIIHLFNLRKHKKIYFSNIYFLQKIQTKSKAKQKIKRWVLLLNRLSIISSLILAFSLPFIANSPNEQPIKKIGIYLDNSFSMSFLHRQHSINNSGKKKC